MDITYAVWNGFPLRVIPLVLIAIFVALIFSYFLFPNAWRRFWQKFAKKKGIKTKEIKADKK